MSDDDLDPKEVARHFNESLESNMRLYEQVFGEGPETAPKEASMAMPEKPSENAERVHLQWNDGWGTWQEVMPKHAGEPGVVTFIRASTHQRALEALREAREALRAFAAFSDKAERFVEHKAKFGGTTIFPVKDFRLSHFRKAVEVVALIDSILPGDTP